MDYYRFSFARCARSFQQIHCFAMFTPLCLFSMLAFIALRPVSNLIFHAGLLFTGWLIWTFAEYMWHRFWTHGENSKNKQHSSIDRHQYHHTNPREIRVTGLQRLLLFLICVLIISVAAYFNNYFTLLAGIVFGFAWFIMMHYVLHQRWSIHLFPRLHQYHIYHHCKYPNRCHGVSVIWWDILFKTMPPKNARVSERICDFYYKPKKSITNPLLSKA